MMVTEFGKNKIGLDKDILVPLQRLPVLSQLLCCQIQRGWIVHADKEIQIFVFVIQQVVSHSRLPLPKTLERSLSCFQGSFALWFGSRRVRQEN